MRIAILSLVWCLAINVHPAERDNEDHLKNHQCHENSHSFEVFGTSNLRTLYHNSFKNVNKFSIAFGSPMKIRCNGIIGNATRLRITKDGKKIHAYSFKNTLSWSVDKLRLKPAEYKYVCEDVENGCKHAVTAIVTPGLTVTSPNIHVSIEDLKTYYIIQYGSPVAILCSSSVPTALAMTKNGDIGKPLLTKHENNATIKWSTERLSMEIAEYNCTDGDTGINSSAVVVIIPQIEIKIQNKTLTPLYYDYENNSPEYYVTHEDSVEVLCTSSRSVELFSFQDNDNEIEPISSANETSVWLVKQMKSGIIVIGCRDKTFSNITNVVRVIVRPLMEFQSPTKSSIGTNHYVITYGDPIEIICTGSNAARLEIRSNYLKKPQVQIINATTIKYTGEAKIKTEHLHYSCFHKRTSDLIIGDNRTTRIKAFVHVNLLPGHIEGFNCISYSGTYINCTWKDPEYEYKTLSLYFYLYGFPYVICSSPNSHFCSSPESSSRLKFCTWEYKYLYTINLLNFRMHICNGIGCSNQEFVMNHLSIVKLDPVQELTVIHTTSRSAVLRWYADNLNIADESLDSESSGYQYKIQYWYYGIKPRLGNSSAIRCRNPYCRIELTLPCPGQFYEVWINQKLAAVGEDLWSDSSTVTFYTNVDDEIGTEPTCHQGPQVTGAVMKYFVQELREEIRQDMKPVKKEISALRKKLATIRSYLKSYR